MSRDKLRRAAVVVSGAALIAGVSAAWGGETDRGGFDLELSTTAPGTVTGLNFHILYKHPDDPEAKPPSVTSAVFELPSGMRIDDDAVPQCTASDDDFRAQGRGACPGETQIGQGKLTAMTGVPGADPVMADIVAFNGDGELVEVVFFEGTNAVAGMDRLTIEEGRLVAHPPATPGGPPDGRTAVREIELDLPARTGPDGRNYVTAPPDCPTGIWLSRAEYEFEDGGTTVVTSEAPCSQTPPAKPAIRVAVKPKRVPSGTRTKFRIAATSTRPRCARHARVRLGGHRRRTGDRGRARLRAAFARAGRKRVRVSKAGCETGRAVVRVVAPD